MKISCTWANLTKTNNDKGKERRGGSRGSTVPALVLNYFIGLWITAENGSWRSLRQAFNRWTWKCRWDFPTTAGSFINNILCRSGLQLQNMHQLMKTWGDMGGLPLFTMDWIIRSYNLWKRLINRFWSFV